MSTAPLISPERVALCLHDRSAVKCAECLPTHYRHAVDEIERLRALLNTPRIDNFLEAVRQEAAHQVERWGPDHDAGKAPADWFWLLGYLSGKALNAAIKGDREKALHHTISSAAVLLNWHAQLFGEPTAMRPGIEPPPESA